MRIAEPLMSYAGLRSVRFAAKYAKHSYVRVGPRQEIRQLSEAECEQFRQHVEAARLGPVKAASWNPWQQ